MTEPSRNREEDGFSELLFTATLSPYRSLSLRGFNILIAAVAVVSFALGIAFVTMGAWPVFGFFGLDAALIYWAFRRNYLDARAFEEFRLSREELSIRRVSAFGRESRFSFNPYWTRLLIDRRAHGIAGLTLSSGRQRLAIGGFLSPDERGAFADALSSALATARTAPAVN